VESVSKSGFPEQKLAAFRNRNNMVNAASESWRPQLFSGATSRFAFFTAAIRRFFDIQAGSAWRDLSAILPTVEGTILDVGCGAQPFRSLVNPRAVYQGIDTTEAKAHFGYEMPDTTYFSGDVWPAADQSVDVVLCTEALEHVLDSRQFLAEAHRCLIPGGMLLLTVPFSARWHFIPYDYWRFTPSSLNYLLGTMGFNRVRVYARGDATTVACYKVMALILRLLVPQNVSRVTGLLYRALGLFFAPFFVLLAIMATLSLRGSGGDDCLGYTVFAVREPEAAGQG
jgi:SAM-dependent methyltransferase